MSKQRAFILAIFIFGAISNGFSQSVEQPSGLLLTWQQDPTTTMTIDWHTVPGDDAVSILFYMKQGDSEWLEMPAEQLAYPFSDRTIHRAGLRGLEPDTDYSFRVGEFTRIYSFYTMPAELTRPIRFVVGSDSRHNCELMNNVAMMYDPDFIIWGGDIALADGMEERVDRWYGWFENYRDNLISDEGRVVPFLAGIGNHEMKRQYAGNFYYLFDNYEDTDEWRAFAAPYFIQLFAYPGQPGYNVLDFGDYLSLISLDSDHLNPIEGEQKEWLESVLAERQHIPNVFPVYHTPAYPSHRDFNEPFSQSVRSHWVPLFEQFGIKVAFEAHDHAYKRTYPLFEGNINTERGIVFIGDGPWGQSPRPGDNRHAWYIDQTRSVLHGRFITITEDDAEIVAIDASGVEFDYYATSFRDNMPSAVDPISPEPAASGLDLRPVFVWEASENADETTTYELELSTHSQFNDISLQVAHITGITDTEYQLEEDLEDQKIYFWRVRVKNFAGYSNWSSVRSFFTFEEQEPDPTSVKDEGNIPTRVVLYQNSPNPYNPHTIIRFGLSEETEVHLEVFNMSGQRVRTVLNSRMSAGYHQVLFDASGLSSGTYLYRLQTPEISQTKIFTLIK